MGSVTILLLPFFPIIYFIMFLGSMFGTVTGANITEVALPYDEANGIVWTCERTDYDWFELKDIKVKGDTQIFVFKAGNGESHCSAVVFKAENGEELVYYARDVGPAFPIYGKVRLYAPDEYIIYDYVPEPEIECEKGSWHTTTAGPSRDYYFGSTEVDGKAAVKVICFEDVPFTHVYSYRGVTADGTEVSEMIEVRYEFTKEKGLVVEEIGKR